MQKTIKGKRIRISNESREFVHWKENALVRANYNDLKNGVHETTEYLELFLRNLLLDEKNELHNRTMHISGRFAEVDIERVKVDIKSGEVDIESTKVDIRNKLLSFSDTISEKTLEALKRLQEKGVKLVWQQEEDRCLSHILKELSLMHFLHTMGLIAMITVEHSIAIVFH